MARTLPPPPETDLVTAYAERFAAYLRFCEATTPEDKLETRGALMAANARLQLELRHAARLPLVWVSAGGLA